MFLVVRRKHGKFKPKLIYIKNMIWKHSYDVIVNDHALIELFLALLFLRIMKLLVFE